MLNSDDVPVDGSTSRSGRKDDGNMEVMMVDGLNHNIDYDAAGDDKNIPPLSSLFAGYKFWWKFAVWPTIFYVMNGVIFGTLIVFDEFEYNSRRDSSFSKENVASYGYKVPDTNTYLAMLRFNALVFAIVLFIDAILLYVAARQVEKEVKVIDDDDLASEDTMPPTDRTSPAAPTSELNYGRHETVYGQVSCKLDAILGRRRAVGPFRSSQRPRDSILVGLLLLACALCAAFGVASVAEWCFTWTAKADKICKSRFGYRSSSGNKKELKPIAGIPDDLQDWARQRYRYSTPSIGFLQLKDKTTIMSSPDPRNSVNKSSSTDVYDQSWDPAILVAIGADGSARFFPNVAQPRLTVRLIEKDGIDDPLYAHGFCSIYNTYGDVRPSQRNSPTGISMMCVDPSDYASIQAQGDFRNVSLVQYGSRSKAGRGSHRAVDVQIQLIALRWFANSVWVMIVSQGDEAYYVQYYSTTVVQEQPLKLTPVGNVTEVFEGDRGYYSFSGREGESACTKRRKVTQAATLAVSFFLAYFWLTRICQLAGAGVVPLVTGVVAAVSCISSTLAAVLSSLASFAALVTLQGCGGIPLLIALASEELVWFLYAAIGSAANAGSPNLEEFYFFAFLVSVVVGTMLGHPALYLAGWTGGIGAVLVGTFLLFTQQRVAGIKSICLGAIGGPGCVTVGLFAMQYRVYCSYYAKRAWKAVAQGMRVSATVSTPGTADATVATAGSRRSASQFVGPTGTRDADDHPSSLTAGLLHRNN